METYNIADEVRDLLIKYRGDAVVQKLDRRFSEPSFLEIIGVERKENYHSNFLKWLFEDKETASNAVYSLLLLLAKKCNENKNYNLPKELNDRVLSGDFIINSIKANRETSIDGGRTDILININDDECRILIENKINASETTKNIEDNKEVLYQTETYWDHYKSQKDKMWFVYLKPLPHDAIKCHCKKFIKINYQDLLDNVLIPLTKDDQISYRKQVLIGEYIKSLSITYELDGNIMAMDEETRKLLKKFWENNDLLISLAIDALLEDPELVENKEDVKLIKAGISSIQSVKRQYTILFPGSNPLTVNGPTKLGVVLAKYLAQQSDKKALLKKWGVLNVGQENRDKRYIQESSNTATSSEEITSKDGFILYSSNQWNNDKVADLIEKCEKIGITITKN